MRTPATSDQPSRGPVIPVEITPPDANVRTLVHEYGGGSWWLGTGGVYWVDLADQRLRFTDDSGTSVITPEPPTPRGHRYADGVVTADGRFSICVRERHDGDGEPANEIASVANDGSGVSALWAKSDFVSSPRLSADGTRLAFISWDHPEMPWTRTRLHVHAFADGRLGDELIRLDGDRAFCEPGWVDDRLLVVVDDDGWWNLHAVDLVDASLTPVLAGPFEIATPPWVFGMQRWASIDGSIVAVAALPTGDELIVDGRTITTVDSTINSLHAGRSQLVCTGAGYDHETEVVALTVADGAPIRRAVKPARALPFDRRFLVEPEFISFPTGEDGSEIAHGLFYPPTNPDHVAPAGERPPLLVLAHGGPTAQARRQLQTAILFWTSRGIAVVDVDYRGSTGYGRAYRQALDDRWGIADVEDCVAAARHLADRGDVDPDRLMIRGGSAGGFTVLSALAFHDVFAVGASRYGVADLEALATDTHKFEARYLDSLVGPYPEARDVYVARSPINHVDQLAAPMIVLQGDEDEIVPPNQSEMIVDALRAKGVEVEYLLFEGEQHGFRKAENIVAALEAELAFFGRILGFVPG
ncbi:MAG: peptidase [Acidimicrobiales bacterium]|nr:MAG: peptidase [Acidimicrobiales bacterium]